MSSAPRCLVRGSINVDEFFHVKDIVRPGETISSSSLSKRSGGKGANQAVAVAKAGGAVSLVGAIGPDGDSVKDNIAQFGVDVQGIELVQEPTGRAIIQLTEGGENSIILFKGANHATLAAPTTSSFEPYTHMLLQNEIPFETTLEYLSMSKHSQRPITVTYNPSPMPTPAQISGEIRWDCIDWLVVNEGEARELLAAFTDAPPPDITRLSLTTDEPLPKLLATQLQPYLDLLSQFASSPLFKYVNIACTLGPLGVLAHLPFVDGGCVLFEPGARVDVVVDTTGAGDCWTGYLVAGLMRIDESHARASVEAELSVQEARSLLKESNVAAALCVAKNGAMESFPDRTAVITP
ncbi:Ribokinase-like protein [Athelia psychrophila]|uniref:Ribokinase n=1 Tax=Athelia psychrophila TaxID=1759441 RepID=A0A166FZL6_9AGAM|nr:Ribokinase-like protein [Fibularhizoctonia sp. CBS 109695]KZP17326.1 Ribokinase-like protein [Fibularhizoctonia sp. CBS 109695]